MLPVMGNETVEHFFTVDVVTNQTNVKHFLDSVEGG